METPEPIKPGVWKRIFHHPNFNAFCGIIGILSFIVGFYFYFASIKKSEIVYYVSSSRTPLVQIGELNDFSVAFHGVPISGDLSSVEIQVWNSGRLAVRKSDILSDTVRIKAATNVMIYRVTPSSTRDVIGLSAVPSTNTASGFIDFDWKILEQNDGVKFQIIYGGKINVPFIVEGIFSDQKQAIAYQASTTKKSGKDITMLRGNIIAALIWGTMMFANYREHKKKKNELTAKLTVYICLVVLLVFLVEIGLQLYWMYSAPTNPPLGF